MKNSPTSSDQTPVRDHKKFNHELRSTAQGLLGYLLIFSDDIKPLLDEKQARMLERINWFAKKMADMLLDLLSDQNESTRG